jgi:hypothetical protein
MHEIPVIPCTVPCFEVEICGFWAEFAEFVVCGEEIRCKIPCPREFLTVGRRLPAKPAHKPDRAFEILP